MAIDEGGICGVHVGTLLKARLWGLICFMSLGLACSRHLINPFTKCDRTFGVPSHL